MGCLKKSLKVTSIVVGILVCFYIFMLALAFGVHPVAFVALVFLVLFFRALFLNKPKHLKIIYLSLTLLCSVWAFHRDITNLYYSCFATVKDGDSVDLSLYIPFKEGTKAAMLDKTSTLRFSKEDDLPKMDGATALYPLYAAFAQAVYPKDDYSLLGGRSMDGGYRWWSSEDDIVFCTTTIGAYSNIIDGSADIIFVAGPSEKQLKNAKKEGVELKFTPIGKEAFVFFVNSKNKVDSLTTEQIQNIYTKDVRNWSQVGGNFSSIRPFQRPEDSGSQTRMIKFMGDKRLAHPLTHEVVRPMSGVIELTSNYRNHGNAIGYSFLFFATEMVENDKIKLISVDGVKPTRENVKNGTYPYASEFFAVTRKDNENPNVDKLIKWILSPEGQELVEKTGYTPVK